MRGGVIMSVVKAEKKTDKDLKLEELIMRGFLQKTVTIVKGLTFTVRTLSAEEIAFVYTLVEKKLKEYETEKPLNQQFLVLHTQALLAMAVIRKNGQPIEVEVEGASGVSKVPMPDRIVGNKDFKGSYVEVALSKMDAISSISGNILTKLSEEYNNLMEEVNSLIGKEDEIKNESTQEKDG